VWHAPTVRAVVVVMCLVCSSCVAEGGRPVTLIESGGSAVIVAVSTTDEPSRPECVLLHMERDASGPVVIEHHDVTWDLDATRPFGITLHDAACASIAATFPDGDLHPLAIGSQDGWVRWVDGVLTGELELRELAGPLRVVEIGPRSVR
jgi:hypothetical protein